MQRRLARRLARAPAGAARLCPLYAGRRPWASHPQDSAPSCWLGMKNRSHARRDHQPARENGFAARGARQHRGLSPLAHFGPASAAAWLPDEAIVDPFPRPMPMRSMRSRESRSAGGVQRAEPAAGRACTVPTGNWKHDAWWCRRHQGRSRCAGRPQRLRDSPAPR